MAGLWTDQTMTMTIHHYAVKVRHDQGVITLEMWAVSEESARRMVCFAERCPDRAIIEVKILETREV